MTAGISFRWIASHLAVSKGPATEIPQESERLEGAAAPDWHSRGRASLPHRTRWATMFPGQLALTVGGSGRSAHFFCWGEAMSGVGKRSEIETRGPSAVDPELAAELAGIVRSCGLELVRVERKG